MIHAQQRGIVIILASFSFLQKLDIFKMTKL